MTIAVEIQAGWFDIEVPDDIDEDVLDDLVWDAVKDRVEFEFGEVVKDA